MSNRKRTLLERISRRLKPGRCPRCGFERRMSKEYADAWLHVCTRCQFPERVVK